MSIPTLDNLVGTGDIRDYRVEDLDAYGNLGQSAQGRNSQRVVLTMPSGESLVISTWCSGCAENTGFHFGD